MSVRKVRLLSVVLAVALAVGGVFAYRALRPASTAQTVRTVTASVGTVTESVTASGSVEAGTTRSLSFGASGTVKDVLVEVGARVDAGQPLAHVEDTTAQTQVRQAKSSLAIAQAKYAQLRDGLTATERQQLELGLEQATMSVTNAERSLADAKASAAIDSQNLSLSQEAASRTAANAETNNALNAVTAQAQLDQAQSSLDNVKKNAELNAKSAQAAIDAAKTNLANIQTNLELSALSYQATVDGAQMNLDNAKKTAATTVIATTQAQLDAAAATAEKNAQAVAAAELSLSNAKLQQTTNLQRDAQTLATAQAAIVSAQTNAATSAEKDAQSIRTAEAQLKSAQLSRDAAATKDGQSLEQAQAGLSTSEVSKASTDLKTRQSVANAESQLRTARLNLASTRLNNTLKLAPAKQADLLAAQASVDQAQASLTTAEETLAKTTLTAPFAGTITAVNVVAGDTAGSSSGSSSGSGGNGNSSASSSSAAFTLTDLDNLYVTASFSEANAAKVQIGQSATVTFDALPNVSVSATVDSVALAATTSANVVSFPVRLKLDPLAVASGVKPGMTAQTEVVTNEAVDVITVPSAAVRSVGGRRTVTLYNPTTKAQTPTQVTIGLRGASTTEIKTGIADGDVLVLPTQNLAAITAAATTATRTGGLGGAGTGLGGGGFGGGGGGFGGGGGGGGGRG